MTRTVPARAITMILLCTLTVGLMATDDAHAIATTSTSSSTPTTYVVQPGDYLGRIAAKLHVSLDALLAANKMTLKSVIVPGQRLVVPGAPPSTSTGTSGSTKAPALPASTPYVVRSGDSLSGISSRFKVRLSTFMTLNHFTLASPLYPGMTVLVPAGSNPTPPAPPVKASTAAAKITKVITFATAQVGKPYVFDTAGPRTYDCSGLVLAAYATIGVALPHQSMMQATYGASIDWRNEPIQAGDLVFTASIAAPTVISHVGLALGPTTWVQAPRPGDVVRIGPLPAKDKIVAVRRIVQP